ncbi:hypothetical protein SAY87_016308 [Trapa incisa]|uniref:RRM domain-containing protein n=2 Tax=Trapa TaxID=22665 RepID=A0AAN7LDU8_TRANT|nr:hypothetical protein SAY87_016308 [Trapa incisa]KAK4786073.1 hypothetical protein SAY86_002762 [Trapa natans]
MQLSLHCKIKFVLLIPSEKSVIPSYRVEILQKPGLEIRPSLLFMAKRLGSQLFVSRLSFYTTEEGLRRLFTPFGAVKEARILRDVKSGRPKGFGFVSYDSQAEAQRALRGLNGRIINGRLIFVEFAKSQEGEKQKDQK